jgi:hypothetical protein
MQTRENSVWGPPAENCLTTKRRRSGWRTSRALVSLLLTAATSGEHSTVTTTWALPFRALFFSEFSVHP